MKISVDLNQSRISSDGSGRSNVYIWKNLGQLKEFYSGIVDPIEIDSLAEKLYKGSNGNGNWQFRERAGIGKVLNESCLCNMIEIILLNKTEVLDTFLEKPVAFASIQ